jgi:hypothetical protein
MKIDFSNPLVFVLLLACAGLSFLTLLVPIVLIFDPDRAPILAALAGVWGTVLTTAIGAVVMRGKRNGNSKAD